MKKKKGFTLVELLAVIVILAVILIIAMPKISDVIKNSKEASLETTAKLIASQAEKKYTENQVLDGSGTISCSDVAKISTNDYESCNITFDDKGNAKVTIVGKGKFDGMAVCNANKNSASISNTCQTDISEFIYRSRDSYIYIDSYKRIKVESYDIDTEKCKAYINNNMVYNIPVSMVATKENILSLCNDEPTLLSAIGTVVNVKDILEASGNGYVGLIFYDSTNKNYEKAGFTNIKYTENNKNITIPKYIEDEVIEEYSINKEKCYVIVSTLYNEALKTVCDGETVNGMNLDNILKTNTNTAKQLEKLGGIYNCSYKKTGTKSYISNVYLGENSLSGLESVTMQDNVTSIDSYALMNNLFNTITIPSSVTSINTHAFANNPNLTKIVNKTGKAFDWNDICGGTSGDAFVTGTVKVSDTQTIEIVAE